MTTERERVEDAKAGITEAKGVLKRIIGNLTSIMDANGDDAVKMNAAYLARAKFRRIAAELEEAHGESTQLLLKHWPNFSEIVAFGPGGGR